MTIAKAIPSQGMNPGACVVQITLEEARVAQPSLRDMIRLAKACPVQYETARAECITLNR